MQADIQWFEAHLKSLYAAYPEKFLAVKEKRVLGAYDDPASAVRGTSFPQGEYLLRQCFSDIADYTIHIYTPFMVSP